MGFDRSRQWILECEKGINNCLDKQFTLRQALNFLLERGNEEAEKTDDGEVD